MKIGDIVKLKNGYYRDCKDNPIWGGEHGCVSGKILTHDQGVMTVNWYNGSINTYLTHELEPVRESLKDYNLRNLKELKRPLKSKSKAQCLRELDAKLDQILETDDLL